MLPPNLVIRTGSVPAGMPIMAITPRRLPIRDLQPGEAVSLSGFAVQKVDPARRTVTLRARRHGPMRRPLACGSAFLNSDPMPDYRAQQIVDVPFGEVIETRESRLRAEVAGLATGSIRMRRRWHWANISWLPNPLAALPDLLDQTARVNIATIHGDFNLENILIEPQLGDVSLIDFADARQDHVLHDLLHLETEIVIHILPNVIYRHQLDPALVLAELGWRLHQAHGAPADEHSLPEHPSCTSHG